MRTNKGFSLVELMIVVAIIGILAAIAIPNFITMQLKAKRGELPGNVDGIKTAELAYDASFDGFLAATASPSTAPTKATAAWADAGGFGSIGWAPDGRVRGQYSVANITNSNFDVLGTSDVDGDGTRAGYTAGAQTNATLRSTDTNTY